MTTQSVKVPPVSMPQMKSFIGVLVPDTIPPTRAAGNGFASSRGATPT